MSGSNNVSSTTNVINTNASPARAAFALRLRSLRMAHGLSQAGLAKKLSCHKSSINMYERAEREPSLQLLRNISEFFNISTDKLLY